MVRLTRGRLWIVVLAALLTGIVALNMVALSISASSGETARAVEELTLEGSALRAQLAEELSNDRIHTAAAMLGLIVPEPGSIRYRRPSEDDALEAARRLRSGELQRERASTSPPPTSLAVPAPVAPPPAASPEADPAPAPAPASEPPAPAASPQGGTAPGGGGLDSGAAGAGGVAPP